MPLSPWDHELSEQELAARDAFQMSVVEAAGFGPLTRELLDRVNPTGKWRAKKKTYASLTSSP